MKTQSNPPHTTRTGRLWHHLVETSKANSRLLALSALLAVAASATAQLPTPIIDVGFNENTGTSVANSGSAGGSLNRATPVPYWSDNVPSGVGGSSSVDFQTTTGNYYVESPSNYPQLTGLTQFTLAGWVNCRSSTIGNGGNRVVTWIKHGGNGVDLVYLANGSLRIGINQWPDATAGTTNVSSAGKITTDAAAAATNWVFFAVTYDSALAASHLKFYFGNNTTDAALDVAKDYYRGAVGTVISNLCIGAFNIATRGGSTYNRMFRGLIDEVKVFGEALTPEQIVSVQRAGMVSLPPGFAQEPVSRNVLENQPVTFSVVVTGTPPLYVQWQRNSEDLPSANGITYSIPAATMADDGATFRVVATNAFGQATSSNAILTVIRDEIAPTVLAVTTERTARNLTNVTVTFSEPVDEGSAQEPGNYVLNEGTLTTYSAALQPDLVTVVLTIDALTPEATHTLFISGITDRAGVPNVMIDTNWVFNGPPTRLPPVIALRFEEGSGTSVANSGTAEGTLTLSTPVPAWANNAPIGLGSASSVDFGTTTGNYYVESPTPYPQLAGLTRFTIAGWVNNRSSTIGGGGNRLVAWNSPNSDGVDLVYQSDGSLQVGINQWPDNVPARSSAAKITTDPNAGADNWRFFAVTYDATLSSEQVKFYFGNNTDEATLDVATTYARGAVGSNIRPLVIGHFNDISRASSTLWDRMFRGIIDEVQVFDDALSLEEIVAVQRPGGLSAPGFTLEPVSQTVLEGQLVTFSVVVTGTPPLFVQWQRDNSDILGANGLIYSLPAVSASDDGANFRVIVSNGLGDATSSNAVLTVIRDIVPPTVLAVTPARSARNLTNVTVQFSEPVDAGSAQEPGNYLLDGGNLTTYSAVLQPDLMTVLLTLDPVTPDASHTLTIAGVTDRASVPNVMEETNWTFTGPPAQLPPIMALRFAEGTGTTATNSGTLGGSATFVQQNAYPMFSANVPAGPYAPAGNTSAVDFGDIAASEGARAIDLTTALGPNGSVGALNAFTVCGWVNARNLNEGWGGNRIAYAAAAMNGPGFDIVQLAGGALRIGVNEWPDNGATGGGPLSSSGKITADPQARAANWVFFAVTYDSSVSGGEIRYYFGTPDQAVQLDIASPYARGPILTSGTLTVGNFSTVDTGARTGLGPNGPSRVFRGVIDELQVFDEAFSLEQLQVIQIAPPAAPMLAVTLDGNEIVLSWDSPASFQLQYREDGAVGTWEDETTTPEVNGSLKTVRLPFTGTSRFYRLQSQ